MTERPKKKLAFSADTKDGADDSITVIPEVIPEGNNIIHVPKTDIIPPDSTSPKDDDAGSAPEKTTAPFDIEIHDPAPNADDTDNKQTSSVSGPMGDYYNSERYRNSHSVSRASFRPKTTGRGSVYTGSFSTRMDGVNTGDLRCMELALASANAQLTESRSSNQTLEYRVQFLEGEVSRHQHQIGSSKTRYKALQSEVYELQTAKTLLKDNNEDMIAEKEELQQEMTEVIMGEREKVQAVQLQIMDLNIQLDQSAMEQANKERLLSQVMNENERLKRYRQEMRESDSGQKDVQVKLFHCEKQKGILEREVEKLNDIATEKDEELKKLKVEHAKVTEALKKSQLEVGTVGAFMTALAQKSNKLNDSNDGKGHHKKVTITTPDMTGGNSSVGGDSLAETLSDALKAVDDARIDDGGEVGMELSENLHLRVVHVDNVEVALSIEREGLRALVAEGMVMFEELYNCYRVMQNIGYEDAKNAAKMMIDLHNHTNNIIDDGGYHTDGSDHHHHSPGSHGTPNRARLEHHNPGTTPHQFMTSSGGTKGCYFASWYCQKGPDLMTAWLMCLNLYSPALVNMLINAGFWDMHSLVHMTEADMQALNIITGIRRKLLSGIDELREKTKVVTEETLAMIRDTFYVSEERYLLEREMRAEDGDLQIATLKNKRLLERAKGDIAEVANGLPMHENDVSSHHLTTMAAGGDKKASVTPSIKRKAPVVIAELFKDLHAWYSDVKASLDGNEAAVKRALEVNSTR